MEDLSAVDLDALLKILRDRAADPTAWHRLEALRELQRRAPLPDLAVAAVAEALRDPDCWTDESDTYDCEEARERRYVDRAADEVLLAHGAGALRELLRVWHQHPPTMNRHLQEFLERVDPEHLALVADVPTTRDAIRSMVDHPAHDETAPTRKILRWTLAQHGRVFRDALLAHPSAPIRAAAATALGARNDPGDFERLLEFAATEDDARPACAAVRALRRMPVPAVPEAALRHLPPMFRSTTAHAWLELCELVRSLGARGIGCASQLARLVVAPTVRFDEDTKKVGYAAALALRTLGELHGGLPDEARQILLDADDSDDASVPYRRNYALGRP